MAAQFEECREKITEMPNIIKDLCRLLYYGKVRALVLFLNEYLAIKYLRQSSHFKANMSTVEKTYVRSQFIFMGYRTLVPCFGFFYLYQFNDCILNLLSRFHILLTDN